MKIDYLENLKEIPLSYLPDVKGERTFVITEDLYITLSNGKELHIEKGFETDLMSIPTWLWSFFKPMDKGLLADLIHDKLWVDKLKQIEYFDNSIYKAREFSDEERLRWRKALAPEKKFKNITTHFVLRLIGRYFYTKRIKIPN